MKNMLCWLISLMGIVAATPSHANIYTPSGTTPVENGDLLVGDGEHRVVSTPMTLTLPAYSRVTSWEGVISQVPDAYEPAALATLHLRKVSANPNTVCYQKHEGYMLEKSDDDRYFMMSKINITGGAQTQSVPDREYLCADDDDVQITPFVMKGVLEPGEYRLSLFYTEFQK